MQINTIRPTETGLAVYTHPLFTLAYPRSSPALESPKDPISDYLAKLMPGSWIESVAPDDDGLKALRSQRVLRLDLYAHFAAADLWKIWPKGVIRDHLLEVAYRDDPLIDQSRRVKCEVEKKMKNGQVHRTRWIQLPAIAVVDGVRFALEVSVVDTCAMAGQAGMSLAGFHQCAGIPMADKDNYSRDQKETMIFQFIAACDQAGIERGAYKELTKNSEHLIEAALIHLQGYPGANPFTAYAGGDVETLYSAVEAFDRQFRSLYESLGFSKFYKEPRFTVGSTVHNLIKAAVFAHFEESLGYPLKKEDKQQILEIGFEPARARGLAEQASWAAANARVFGGRVLSTAPTLISRKGAAICDMDLAGAYARSMDVQILPAGEPIIDLKFSRRSPQNDYQSLEKYLAQYGHEFVPGCWQLLISVEDSSGKALELPSDQDFFTSWTTPAIFEGLKAIDEDDGVWLERGDTSKVYTRQITNSIFTSDSLDWLNYCCSRELRKFILQNARVKASLFYPKSERLDTPKAFLSAKERHTGQHHKNTATVKVRKGKSSTTVTEREFHGWYGVLVSDLITTALTAERNRWKPFTKMYGLLREFEITEVDQIDKLKPVHREEFVELAEKHEGGARGLIAASKKGGKHPKDELAKLCSNTVYGDLVSRFFELSNPAVGNNITARVRAIIWYFEKACRAWNSITDGGLFDLNEVHAWKPGRRGGLNEKNTVFAPEQGYHYLKDQGILLRPLGHANADPVISWNWNGDRIVLERASGTTEMDVIAAQKIIDELTLEQVQSCFDHRIAVINPKDSVFTFESKGIVQDAAIHGTANYCLRGGHHDSYKAGRKWTVKVRSYPASTHEKVLKPFFDQLIDHPDRVDRSRYWTPFNQSTILKVRRFRDGYKNYYSKTVLEPGDTEYGVKLFREFTPSAFRFRTIAQEKAFVNFHASRRDIGNPTSPGGRARGQSFEAFFLNRDGTLDYTRMMQEVEAAIRAGKSRIHPELEIPPHPRQERALEMKRQRLRELVKTEDRYEQMTMLDPAEIEIEDWMYFD